MQPAQKTLKKEARSEQKCEWNTAYDLASCYAMSNTPSDSQCNPLQQLLPNPVHPGSRGAIRAKKICRPREADQTDFKLSPLF